MRIEFANKDVEKMCTDSRRMESLLPRKVAIALQKLIYKLCALDQIDSFRRCSELKSYKLHKLKGKVYEKRAVYALRIEYQYRMELVICIESDESGQSLIKILEISNHYGD